MSALTGGAAGQPSSPDASRIRTPRQILSARQARQRGEEDANRRAQEAAAAAEEEAQRKIDLERRKSAERRAAAAGASSQKRDSGYRTAAPTVGGRTPGQPAYTTPTAPAQAFQPASSQHMRGQSGGSGFSDAPAPTTGYRTAGATGSTRLSQQMGPQPSQRTSYPPQAQQQQQQPQTQPGQPYQTPSAQPQQPSQPSGQPAAARSSFPHAFERWEQLSAQWEGITSSFIRKLETYVTETGPLPPDQAVMGRQISDLSMAGANLFHAVVELQRLRASSERKFQRWFFETRSQQEAYAEEIARLERDLDSTRNEVRSIRGRGGMDAASERRLQEMRRELQISKEEAKRAWEELGRRTEIELIQQNDLRSGKAVFVGGVQVLPSNVVSRGASLRQPEGREVYSTTQGTPAGQATSAGQGTYEYQEPSPTDTDPFTDTQQRQRQPVYQGPAPQMQQMQQQQAPAEGGSGDARFYNQPQTYLHGQRPSLGGVSESDDDPGPELDQHGNIRTDDRGQPIPFRGIPTTVAPVAPSLPPIFGGSGGMSTSGPPPAIPPSALRQQREEAGQQFDPVSSSESSEIGLEDDEYTLHQARREQRYTQAQEQTSVMGPPQTIPGQYPGPTQGDAADYEGEGFGSGRGWEEMPRHQHPTRLSDVIEEEEERASRAR